MKQAKARLGYLPGLDGLRALAVLAVLLYHADLHWFQGGFLGVEIFFVISGYLITSLLLTEWQERGRIDLKAFWLRRARRLLPALFLLLAAVLTLAVLFLPGEVAGLRGDAAAALGYVTNWYLILSNKSYFEAVGRPSLLQHLWSLAVEEQFYLLWPLILTLLLKRFAVRGNRPVAARQGAVSPKRGDVATRPGDVSPKRLYQVLYIVLAGAIASTVLMAVLYSPDVDPSRVYYGTDTRAAGLLTGAALAFVWRPRQIKKQARRFNAGRLDWLGVAGLVTLLWACLGINEYAPFLYRGGFAVVSLATALVIAVAVHPRARLGKRFLAWRPLVWVGVRSYGIYLWHWPVFMLTRPQLDVALDGLPLLALRFGLTLLAAELSYRFVETPIRTGGLERAWKAWREAQGTQRQQWGLRWAGAAGAIALFIVLLGNSVVTAQPPAPPAYLAELVSTPTPAEMPVVGETPRPIAMATVESASVSSSSVSSSDIASAMASMPTEALAVSLPITSAQERATPADDGPDVLRPRRVAPAAAPATAAPPAAPTATLKPPLVTGISVTAVGDSVMLGAAPALRQAIQGVDVDAQISRQVSTAVDILQAKHAAGQLGAVVIVHMGTNGGFSAHQFDQMMQATVDARRVIFVNDKVPRPWEDANNSVIAEGVQRYPKAMLLDWQTASTPHPEFFWDDGIHLRPDGARFYAELIAQYILAPGGAGAVSGQ
ncbi:MAG: acyltransferase family protein [Anaerolineae bacterium]